MCVIRNDAKPGVCSVFLHNPSQCHLRGSSHRVCLVEDNKFEGGQGCELARFRGGGEDLLGATEGFDLFPDYVDTAVV